MKKRLSLILLLSASIIAPNALADDIDEVPSQRYVVRLSAGPVWQQGGTTQTFYLAPELEKTYAADQSTGALADGAFFLGTQLTLNHFLQGQLGIEVAATSNAKLTGSIWDDADPQFNNYSYDYHLQHNHINLKGALLIERGSMLTPWISAGLGVGFNHASAFYNTPKIFEAVPNPNFASNTQTSFTYTLGAGVQKGINAHWQVGIGYEFADWGKSSLGHAPGQIQNSGLALDHLYTNGVLFNVVYLQ